MSVDGTTYNFPDSGFHHHAKTSSIRPFPQLTVSTQSSKKNYLSSPFISTSSPYRESAEKGGYTPNDYIFRDSATQPFESSIHNYPYLFDKKTMQSQGAKIDGLENKIEEPEKEFVELCRASWTNPRASVRSKSVVGGEYNIDFVDIPSASFLSRENNFEAFLERIHYEKIWDRLDREKKSADQLIYLNKELDESKGINQNRSPLRNKSSEKGRMTSSTKKRPFTNENQEKVGYNIEHPYPGLMSNIGRVRETINGSSSFVQPRESPFRGRYTQQIDDFDYRRQSLPRQDEDLAYLGESLKAQMGVLEEEKQIKSKMDFINSLYEEMNALTQQTTTLHSLKNSKKDTQSNEKTKSQKRKKSKELSEKTNSKKDKLIPATKEQNKNENISSEKSSSLSYVQNLTALDYIKDEKSDSDAEKTLTIKRKKNIKMNEGDNLTYLNMIEESSDAPDESSHRIQKNNPPNPTEEMDFQATKKASIPNFWPNSHTPVKISQEADSRKYSSVQKTRATVINSSPYDSKTIHQQRGQIKRNNKNFIQSNKNVEQSLRPRYKNYEKSIRTFDSVCNPLISSMKKFEDEPKYCFTHNKRGCSLLNSRYQSPERKSICTRSLGDKFRQRDSATKNYMSNPCEIESLYEGMNDLSEKISQATNVMQQALKQLGRHQSRASEDRDK